MSLWNCHQSVFHRVILSTCCFKDFAHHRHVEDVDQGLIEARLLQQQRESVSDAQWLLEEERNLVSSKLLLFV